MSLDWNAENVRAFERLHSTNTGWLITDSLIWASLFTGMREITAANWREVYTRTKAAHHVTGLCVYRTMGDGAPIERSITPGMVRRRIGLRTNTGGKTKAQFTKWLGETAYRNAAESVR